MCLEPQNKAPRAKDNLPELLLGEGLEVYPVLIGRMPEKGFSKVTTRKASVESVYIQYPMATTTSAVEEDKSPKPQPQPLVANWWNWSTLLSETRRSPHTSNRIGLHLHTFTPTHFHTQNMRWPTVHHCFLWLPLNTQGFFFHVNLSSIDILFIVHSCVHLPKKLIHRFWDSIHQS